MKLNIVPARAGVQWAHSGVRVFWRQPLAFTGLFFLLMLVMSVVAIVPMVGSLLMLALTPAATVGFMAATEHVQAGRFPLPTVLATAFLRSPRNMRAMLLLGVLFAGGVALTEAIFGLLDGGHLAQLQASAQKLTPDLAQNADAQAAFAAAALRSFALLALLSLPVTILFWHAPALVHWHGVPPVKSLFFSAVAVLKNARAFVLYGLAWLLISFAASLLLTALALVAGSTAIIEYGIAPVGLMMTAMVLTSLWFTFRDSFSPDTPVEG
ncbi:MAG: hypothetical protein LBI48_04225 [Burkholderiaceae bacterium]|jgi:hypothetical protein|nr:hypothetical protein [Burkholderiaceae bacterium]